MRYWDSLYIPGTAWSDVGGIYQMDMDFKITYQSYRPSVGVEETELAQVLLAPNPASDRLLVEAAQPVSVEVVDLSGRVVLLERVQQGAQWLELDALPECLYLVRLRAGDAVRVEKLVIQR